MDTKTQYTPKYKYTSWKPTYSDNTTLEDAYIDMQKYVTSTQDDIPWMVQLIENPKYRFFRFGLLQGSTSLLVHDLLHIIMSQSMNMSGEAYIIGFTMGSTKKITRLDLWIFRLFSKYLYPRDFRFNDIQLAIFKQGVVEGLISNAVDLHLSDPEELLQKPLIEVRSLLKII